MPCLITGCALVDDTQARSVWGDLHRIGDTFIFNAVLDPDREAAWQYGKDAACPNVVKQLTIRSNCPAAAVFERRGVIIVHIGWADLNQAAQDYIGKGR